MEHFQKGDRVIYAVGNSALVGKPATILDIDHYLIEFDEPYSGILHDGNIGDGDNRRWWTDPSHLRKIEDEIQPKFQIGDRVKVIGESDLLYFKTGTIVWLFDEVWSDERGYLYGVEFDLLVGGHTCHGHARNGYGWNIREDNLELLSDFVECDPTSLL